MNARIVDPIPTPSPGRGRLRILSGGEFDGLVSVTESIARRGSDPPLHRHQREDLLIYIVAGQVTVHIDGQRLTATAGSCVLAPRGTEHGYTIDSETAHLLTIMTPAGAEGFLAELHGANGTGDAPGPDVERLVSAAARHGIDITGPPPGHG